MTDANKEITVLGETNFRGQRRVFGMYPDDRRRHVYVIGKTGVGKSTLLENMVAQDIVNGKGVCFVDPHGDTVEKLLTTIPPHRINDVVYFDPSDVDYPVGFNILEAIDPKYKYLVASGLVSSLKKIWADSWGPRLEYILRNTILALLDYPSSTVLGILRMLAEKEYRKKVIERIQDPVVKSFWVNEFSNYNERFRSEAISPIQNKVGQLLTSAIIRNIMAQPKSSINMHEAMNEGKIMLINVSKGKIGEDNSALLGAMIINRVQLAAMDRASIPEEQRRDFYLYVDEFQNFATESFADILSEARKYRLNLIVAHQYIAQMEEEVQDAVFGNVGTMVSFRVGAADAEYLEKEFAPTFMQTDLVNLDKHRAYIKLMINGISSKPFSMSTLPPSFTNFGKAETVRLVSRERYGRKREIIEEKIKRWSQAPGAKPSDEGGGDAPRPQPRFPQRAGVTANQGPRPQGNRLPQPLRPTERAAPRPVGPREQTTPRSPTPAPLRERELADITLTTSAEVITDLASFLGTKNAAPAAKPVATPSNPKPTLHTTTCDRCKKQTEVPFKPSPDKPVYCKECLAIVRAEQKKQKPPVAKTAASTPPPWRSPAPPPPPRPRTSVTDTRPVP